MRHISGFVRILVRVALAVYLLLAVAALGLRYVVLPHIDTWRPYIESQLSTALDARVTLRHVAAEWKGLNPSLQLEGVDFTDGARNSSLHVPRIRAVLGWRSLLQGSLRFVLLEVSGMDLAVQRDASGRLQIPGYSFGSDAGGPVAGGDGAGLRWLAVQQQIVLRDATLRWDDQTRHAPELVLQHVTLKIHNQAQRHQFSLVATPPEALGGTLDVRGDFSTDGADAAPAWNGQVYAGMGRVRPLGWKPWFDLPENLESGEVSLKSWLDVRDSKPAHLVADIAVQHGRWSMGPQASVQSDASRLFLTGAWNAFERIFPQQGETEVAPAAGQTAAAAPAAPATPATPATQATPDAPASSATLAAQIGQASPAAPALATPASSSASPATVAGSVAATLAPAGPEIEFHFDTTGLRVEAGEVFVHPLSFDRVAVDGSLMRGADSALAVAVSGSRVVNQDMDARLHGSWREGGSGPAGIADIRGVFARASIDAIDDYLPSTVNLEARQWMAHGLVGGQILNAAVRVQGDMEYFPFGDHPGSGDFSIEGRYRDGIIDYLPPQGKKPGWPRLEDMRGTVTLHRVDLRLNADSATMRPVAGQQIALSGLKARIANLEHNSVLQIDGNSRAPAPAYLSLLGSTPLGGLLGGDFDQARAQGNWQVPIRFDIPLRHSEDTTVQGQILFDGGSVSLMPEMPDFRRVTGALDFSDRGMQADGLEAEFLGGSVNLAGGLGGGQPGLKLRGHATASALTQYVGLVGMKRLHGKFAYEALIQSSRGKPMKITADSTLQGLALDLPAPLAKSAAASLPLRVSWEAAPGGKEMRLAASLGADVSLQLLHVPGRKIPAYFRAGAVGIGLKPEVPAQGLAVAADYPQIDARAWDTVVDEFSTLLPHTPARKGPPVLPELQQLDLRAGLLRLRGLDLTQATFSARRPAPMQWRAEIQSSGTAGTIFWREAQGRIDGQVDAKFSRLTLGGGKDDDAGSQEQDAAKLDDRLDIPGVNLQAEHFSLYGHEMGRLSLTGVNESRGRLWRLEKLSLDGASTKLRGSGSWRLEGPDRGLTVDAQIDTTDIGAYMDQMGFKNTMSGGHGTIKGRLQWLNLPWEYRKSDLNGKLEFSLQKGRFSNINSKSARLLELLSLQSVRRLATLNFSFGSLLKDGFPFDNLRGTVAIAKGVMSTDNYRVTGPAGTIVIGGTTDLNTEKLDLQAVVVPNLDVSGAAIAAGIAVNPIIGIGAFLTQWLLRAPLSKAMTVQYRVTGDWNDPRIDEISQSGAAQSGKGAESAGKGPADQKTPAGQGTSDSSAAGTSAAGEGAQALPQAGARPAQSAH